MSEANLTLENDDRESVTREAEALRDAIAHLRNAKGVLDTFPEAREHVARVEKLADDYQKKLRALDKRIAVWREEVRNAATTRRPV